MAELWVGRPIELEIYPEETVVGNLKVEKWGDKLQF